MAAIVAAGGDAVLAHPHRYKFSRGALRELCAEFRAAGGAAMEVSLPAWRPNDCEPRRLAGAPHGLAGSAARTSTSPGCRGARWAASLSYRKASSRCSPRLGQADLQRDGMTEDSEDNVDRELFRNIEKLRQLRIEHRDLDQVISRLSMDIHADELQMRRLKKRKLLLKDQIAKLESQAIPDLNA